MTNGIRNIEKFMQDLLGNHRVKPYQDSWNKIADTLNNTNPQDGIIPNIDEVAPLLKGYKVTPSEGVWQNIYKILERDRFTVRKLSRSAVSAIIAFFSNTTATVITSLIIAGGIALIIFNPFKENTTKSASIDGTKQVKIIDQTSVHNQQSVIRNSRPAKPFERAQSTINANADYSQTSKPNIKSNNNIQEQIAINNKNLAKITNRQNSDISSLTTNTQNPVISSDIKTSNLIGSNSLIIDPKNKNIYHYDLLVRYPSITMRLKQNRLIYEKVSPLKVDLLKKNKAKGDPFYRQWVKKFNKNREQFYVEVYILPMYGSTTFIAHQKNSPTILRSYNENLISPHNCFGLNLGYNYRKFTYETGILYEARQTTRNDNLTWISYDTNITIKKDSIGFVFNTIDSTYQTIYKSTNDTSFNKKELKKNYRSKMTYKTVDVPLLIGFKFYDKKATWTVRTGLLASFVVQTSEENTFIDESALPYIIYPERNKVEFSYLLNLSYEYKINKNLRVSVTPTFRYNFTGFYKGYPINKNAATFGLGLGAKYLF